MLLKNGCLVRPPSGTGPRRCGPRSFAASATSAMLILGAAASAAAPAYTLIGSFPAPQGSGPIDVLPDGRLLALRGNNLFVQSGPNTGSYSLLGSITPGLVSGFGASFLSVSPDGSTIAIGDGNFGPGSSVLTLPFASLNTAAPATPSVFVSDNFDAAWADNSTLFVAGAGFSTTGVQRIDLNSGTVAQVIDGLDGASGGIAINNGVLYTANGFDFSPGSGSQTGEVRAFNLSALTGPTAPLNFETQGIPVADALSGGSLGFDGLGNLLVGGGDSFGTPPDSGYFASIDSAAIQAALLGAGLAPDAAEFRGTPASSIDLYSAQWNAATGEVLVTFTDGATFGPGGTVFRYAIPAPGVVCFGATWLAFASRRRR